MLKHNSIYYLTKRFYIKFSHWEYWPMWLVYFPVSLYYIFLSIKAKSFFFFSSSNPGIETGGMFFESKWDIFKLIPKEFYPSTLLIGPNENINDVLIQMKNASIDFPIIAKPDRGERGWLVQKINSVDELNKYNNAMHIDFLIQTYIDYPLEFSIFYYRHPKSATGMITSVTLKSLLSVKGDGKNNIETLILSSNRSFLQYERLLKKDEIDFKKVLSLGEEFLLVPYGNHVLGTMFLDYHHIIDQALNDTFNTICKKIEGFYFGRLDLRCNSVEDLKKGKHFSILELNGAGAEPAHIYDPSFSFCKAQLVIAKHFKMMYEAASENKKNGVQFMNYKLYKETKKNEKAYKLKAFK